MGAVVCPAADDPWLVVIFQVEAVPAAVCLVVFHEAAQDVFELRESPGLMVEACFARLVVDVHVFEVEEHLNAYVSGRAGDVKGWGVIPVMVCRL